MPHLRASLLLHRGHGAPHGDLVLAAGARCPTLHLTCRRGCWRAALGEPHRRRYLTWRGPLGVGRGTVAQLWSGPLEGACWARGRTCRLKPNPLLLSGLRRIARAAGSASRELFPSRLEMVVRPPAPARLRRS